MSKNKEYRIVLNSKEKRKIKRELRKSKNHELTVSDIKTYIGYMVENY
jgi:hypothetical protein